MHMLLSEKVKGFPKMKRDSIHTDNRFQSASGALVVVRVVDAVAP